ncbi:MAG TPA: rod shape-determining protein MreC [Vicinamibacterales bacterium]|jgi:rod shape-determining protein MreC
MALPDIRQRSGYLFLAVAVGHIILISVQVNSRSGVPLLQAVVFGAFAEVQRATSGAVRAGRTVWDAYVGLQDVHRQNDALRQRVSDLQVALQRSRELAGESESLRRLLGLRDKTQWSTRPAEIIGTSATADFRTLTIDRGTADGVRADMAVIVPDGVVGRVVMPSRRASKVQLLVDRSAAAAVMVARSRAQGIVLGSGEALLRLEYVSTSADLAVGDQVVTSGIDGIYPAGFVVGLVETIEKAGGSFRAIRVRPAVDFSALERVLVVLAGPAAPAAPGAATPDASAEKRE